MAGSAAKKAAKTRSTAFFWVCVAIGVANALYLGLRLFFRVPLVGGVRETLALSLVVVSELVSGYLYVSDLAEGRKNDSPLDMLGLSLFVHVVVGWSPRMWWLIVLLPVAATYFVVTAVLPMLQGMQGIVNKATAGSMASAAMQVEQEQDTKRLAEQKARLKRR
jgi:hypothetical protein